MTTAREEYRSLFQTYLTLGAKLDAAGQGIGHPEYGKYKNITNRLAQLYSIVGEAFDAECAAEFGLKENQERIAA